MPLVCAALLFRSVYSTFRTLSTPVLVGLVAGALLLVVLSFLATADWLRLSATQRLVDQAAAAAALAVAKKPDLVDATAFAAARAVMGAGEIAVVAERGNARPGPSGIVFVAGPGEVTRVVVSTMARSLLGTPIGLGQRTVTSTAMAMRSGVAALTERTTAVPELGSVPAAIEARLFGTAGTLTVNERALLGQAVFRVADLVNELGRVLATRDGGVAAGSASVAGTSFKPAELLSALAALYRDNAKSSASAASMLAIIDRLAGVETGDETPVPFDGVISLGGADTF